MKNLILGILILLLAFIYMFWLIRHLSVNKDSWGQSMDFKGLVGGIAFIAIGIMLIVKGCNSL